MKFWAPRIPMLYISKLLKSLLLHVGSNRIQPWACGHSWRTLRYFLSFFTSVVPSRLDVWAPKTKYNQTQRSHFQKWSNKTRQPSWVSAHSDLHVAPVCCASLGPLVYRVKLWVRKRRNRWNFIVFVAAFLPKSKSSLFFYKVGRSETRVSSLTF